MATLNPSTLPIDLNVDYLSNFMGSTLSSVTGTSARINVGNQYNYLVTGTGFANANGDNFLDSGTVSSIKIYDNATLLMTIGGVNKSVSSIYSYL